MNGMIWNDLGSSVHLRTADHFSRRMGRSVSASKRRLGDVKAFLSPSPRYSMPGGPQSLNYEQLWNTYKSPAFPNSSLQPYVFSESAIGCNYMTAKLRLLLQGVDGFKFPSKDHRGHMGPPGLKFWLPHGVTIHQLKSRVCRSVDFCGDGICSCRPGSELGWYEMVDIKLIYHWPYIFISRNQTWRHQMKLVESLSWFNPQATHHMFSLGLLGHNKLSRPKPMKHPRCAWGSLEPTGPSWKAPSRILEMKIQRCRKVSTSYLTLGWKLNFIHACI